jgi:hypothetical protein
VYGEDGKFAVPPSKFVEPNLAAGGLWSTPTDLARLLLEVQREYGGNRTSASPANDTDDGFARKGPYITQALWAWLRSGWQPGNPYVRHGGSAYFQDDMVEYLRGNGIIVMTSGGGGGALVDELIRSVGNVYMTPRF